MKNNIQKIFPKALLAVSMAIASFVHAQEAAKEEDFFPIVRVTVTTTGSEVICGQCVAVASVKRDCCASATSVSSLTHGAHNTASRSGNHDPVCAK